MVNYKSIARYSAKAMIGFGVLLSGIISIIGSGTTNTIPYNPGQQRDSCRLRLSAADFGERPKNYKVIIKNYMEKVLKDPDSAKYFWDEALGPEKGFAYDVADAACSGYGWMICVPINAKNSYGGYTGPQRQFFLLKDNSVAYFESVRNMSFNCTYFSEQKL